jgi:large subunit ribosomal protein L7A
MSDDKGLQEAHVKIGTKQTMRMIRLGIAEEVYVAQDADPRITVQIVALCEELSIKITYVDTMKNLGKACGIEIGAAMAAIVKP